MKDKLLKILKDINSDVDYENEQNLVDSGILGSMEIMMIVMAIDEKMDIEIDPNDITADNFNSLGNILNVIDKNK